MGQGNETFELGESIMPILDADLPDCDCSTGQTDVSMHIPYDEGGIAKRKRKMENSQRKLQADGRVDRVLSF